MIALVSKECRFQVADLTHNDPGSSLNSRLRLSANSRPTYTGLKWADIVDNLDVLILSGAFAACTI